MWQDFEAEYDSPNKDKPYDERRWNFQNSLHRIMVHNSMKNKTYTKGVNKFSDMTNDEFMAYYNIKRDGFADEQSCNALNRGPVPLQDGFVVPDTMDWRKEGKVSGVKDQGSCGSCWTFSTVACLESRSLIKTNKTELYSEQQLVDCANENKNDGC